MIDELKRLTLYICFTIFLTGFLMVASYLWHWVGFIFALGTISTTAIACYIAASDNE